MAVMNPLPNCSRPISALRIIRARPKLISTVSSCDRLASPAVEPRNLNAYECTPTKSGIFQRCSSSCSAPSPLKEQHDILYPTLKPLDQMRKHLTPQKFKGPNSIPVKKRVYVPETTTRISLMKVLHNDVVMDHVFKYLSNGDLFRVSMVSRGFRDALLTNFTASNRQVACTKSNLLSGYNGFL